jgi:MFS family permease
MSDAAVTEPALSGRGVLEPEEPGTSARYLKGPENRRYVTWYTISTIAFTAVWGAVLGILLPNHIQLLEFPQWFSGADSGVDLQQLTQLQQEVAAGTATATADEQRLLGILSEFDGARASSLALVTSIGVALTMLIQPVIGVVSDRTRSRLGRRAPWILFGSLVGSAALALLPLAPSIAILAVLFAAAQVLLNTALAPLGATVADRVLESRRGSVSALTGFGNFVGGVVGGIFAGAAFGALGLGIYVIVAIFVALSATLFVLVAKDRSSRDLVVPAHSWKQFFLGFTVALRSRDFRWVWIARVLLTFGYTVSTAMSLYMLQSYVRPALSAAEATGLVPIISLIGMPFTIVAVLVAGKLSDKLGRRKVFVVTASVLMAASFVVPIVWPTLTALFIQAVLAGVAFGIYLPVDQALFIDVLPDQKSAGRDLGVAALGNNLGQALGPVLAGVVVAMTGGYLGVWVAALVLVAIAAVAILPVRGAR